MATRSQSRAVANLTDMRGMLSSGQGKVESDGVWLLGPDVCSGTTMVKIDLGKVGGDFAQVFLRPCLQMTRV